MLNNISTLPNRSTYPNPFWVVGISIDGNKGQVNVHPQALEKSGYNYAIDHAIDMAKAVYPKSRIEFLFIGNNGVIFYVDWDFFFYLPPYRVQFLSVNPFQKHWQE